MLQYLPLLVVLACPVMMGAMMWMMRGRHSATGGPDETAPGTSTLEEIAILRAEVALLREERARRDAPGSAEHAAQ